jgi:hypothetical protein
MTASLHPALRLLWRLQLKAGWRKIARSARTGKGILRLILTLGVLALMFGPMIVFLQYRTPPDPTAARTFLEPGILLFTIMVILGSLQKSSGIYFTPTEVDFLFPGPFQRRELLLYRIGHQVQASVFGALFLSVAPAAFVPRWTFAFIGIALVLQFIQLLSIVLTSTTSLVGQTAYTRARKVALVLIAIPIVVGIFQVLINASGRDLFATVTEFRKSSAGRFVLLPFQVFSRTITAERVPEFVGWGALAAAVNGGLIALILRLDADFYERSVAVSEKVYRALERARRGEAWMGMAKPTGARWRLPMPARLRGAGPIAWRQCTSALRSARAVMVVVLIMAAGIVLLTYATRDEGSGVAIGSLAMFALFMLPHMLQFDFRGDIERIDFLKTLPATPAAVAAGELIAPVLFATVVEWGLLLGIGWLWTDWRTIVAVCAFVPLINLILFSLENIISLYYPRRTGPAAPFQGRHMALNLVKSLSLSAAAGISAGLGAIGYWVTGESMLAGLAIAWCVAAAIGIALIPVVAHAFRVMDPSLESLE